MYFYNPFVHLYIHESRCLCYVCAMCIVCTGTNHGLSFSHNGSDAQYRLQYENCTHILGNLEIVFLDRPLGRENVNRSYDLSFLSSIREVTFLLEWFCIIFSEMTCLLILKFWRKINLILKTRLKSQTMRACACQLVVFSRCARSCNNHVCI